MSLETNWTKLFGDRKKRENKKEEDRLYRILKWHHLVIIFKDEVLHMFG
jgi:hypothetical protein